MQSSCKTPENPEMFLNLCLVVQVQHNVLEFDFVARVALECS